MRNPTPLDLSTAAGSREFLSHIQIDGKQVTGAQLANGQWVEFSQATDSQAIGFANDIFKNVYKGKAGDTVHTQLKSQVH